MEELEDDGDFTPEDKTRFASFMIHAAHQMAEGRGFLKDDPLLGVSSRNLRWFVFVLGTRPRSLKESYVMDRCASCLVVDGDVDSFEVDEFYGDDDYMMDVAITLYSEYKELDRVEFFPSNSSIVGRNFLIRLQEKEYKWSKKERKVSCDWICFDWAACNCAVFDPATSHKVMLPNY